MFKDALSTSLGRAFVPDSPPYSQLRLQLIEAVDADAAAAAMCVSGCEGVRDHQEG